MGLPQPQICPSPRSHLQCRDPASGNTGLYFRAAREARGHVDLKFGAGRSEFKLPHVLCHSWVLMQVTCVLQPSCSVPKGSGSCFLVELLRSLEGILVILAQRRHGGYSINGNSYVYYSVIQCQIPNFLEMLGGTSHGCQQDVCLPFAQSRAMESLHFPQGGCIPGLTWCVMQ